MNGLEFITRLVSALAWPVTTAALALWFVRGARRAGLLTDLKARIQTLKAGPGGVEASFFEYGKSPVDVATPSRSQRVSRASGSRNEVLRGTRFDRAANVYWLGHDLPWTIDVLLRGADKSVVIYGIRQALHHLKAVGMGESAPAVWLERMLETLGQQPSGLDPDQRGQIAQNLRAVVELVGEQVVAHQPDFDPGPRVIGGIDIPETRTDKGATT